MNRETAEMEEAIAKLEINLNRCVPYSCFGEDNKKQIIVMIDVIKHQRSTVWINSTYLSISEMFHEQPINSLWRSAMDAREWLDQQFDIAELLFKEAPFNKSLLDGVLFSKEHVRDNL